MLPARDVYCIDRDEHEDFAAVRKERVGLETLERERRQAFKEGRDIRGSARRGCSHGTPGVGTSTSHSTFESNLSMIADMPPRPNASYIYLTVSTLLMTPPFEPLGLSHWIKMKAGLRLGLVQRILSRYASV